MSGTNQYLLFCNGAPGTANSLSFADYSASGLAAIIANGFQTGVAESDQANTVWRQATMGTAVLGQLVALSNQDALDDQNVTLFASKLLTALASLLPPAQVGDIKMFGSAILEGTGWLACDGSSYLRSDYPALFAVIGTAFGYVDADHFNVPDFRGIFPRGYDNGRGVDIGRVFGSYQADQLPAHVHSVTLPPQSDRDIGVGTGIATGDEPPDDIIPPFNTASTGGTSNGNECRPKNVAIAFFIYYG